MDDLAHLWRALDEKLRYVPGAILSLLLWGAAEGVAYLSMMAARWGTHSIAGFGLLLALLLALGGFWCSPFGKGVGRWIAGLPSWLLAFMILVMTAVPWALDHFGVQLNALRWSAYLFFLTVVLLTFLPKPRLVPFELNLSGSTHFGLSHLPGFAGVALGWALFFWGAGQYPSTKTDTAFLAGLGIVLLAGGVLKWASRARWPGQFDQFRERLPAKGKVDAGLLLEKAILPMNLLPELLLTLAQEAQTASWCDWEKEQVTLLEAGSTLEHCPRCEQPWTCQMGIGWHCTPCKISLFEAAPEKA